MPLSPRMILNLSETFSREAMRTLLQYWGSWSPDDFKNDGSRAFPFSAYSSIPLQPLRAVSAGPKHLSLEKFIYVLPPILQITDYHCQGSSVCTVCTATSYLLDSQGIGDRLPEDTKRSFYSPKGPDRLWSPPSLLSNGRWVYLPLLQSSSGVKVTTQPPPSAEIKNDGAVPPLSHTFSERGA
jgi:hypothetical protein